MNKSQKKTQEQFISEVNTIFGDKYDFSKAVYDGATTKVCVVCPTHGEFFIRPNDLLNRHGCPYCGGTKKLTQEEFVTRANNIHNERYDYSLVEYKNFKTKIPIICHKVDCDGNEHGVFYQTPRSHLQGDGCPKCFRKFKKTTEQFIEEARNVHGDKYDYSKVVYFGNKKLVTINCPKHGDFKQSPLYHLQGHGCQCCYDERRGQTRVLGKEKFIELAREVHGDMYDYSKVEYVNNHTHVVITCPIHGDFIQRPDKYIHRKQGCPRCSESHLERDVALYCDEHGIEYEREKRFPWLKHKAKLPLDFICRNTMSQLNVRANSITGHLKHLVVKALWMV